MSLFNRILVNAASIYTAKVIEGLLQLAVLTFILTQVDRKYYAASLLIISVQATIDIARAGMQKATVKYIAEYRAKNDYAVIKAILSSSSALQGAVGFLGFLFCLIISPYGSSIFSLPEFMQNETRWAIILLGIGIAISFAISPWHNSVAAQERYDLLSFARVSGKLLRAVFVIVLLSLNAPSLISLVLASILGNVFERLICIYLIKKSIPQFEFDIKNISLIYVKLLLGFSFFDFFQTLANLMYHQGSILIAAHLISLDAVAGLGIIGNLSSFISLLMSQIAKMLIPIVSRLHAEGQDEKLRFLIVHGTNITVFMGGAAIVALIPWMHSLLVVWLGNSYAHLAEAAIIMMTASFLINSLTCIHNALGGMGYVKIDGISNIICTFFGIIIGILLIFFIRPDLTGLAIGLFCARLSRFVYLNYYAATVFNIPLGKFMWEGYLRTYLCIIIIFSTILLFSYSPSSWLALIISGGTTTLLYIFIGILLIMDKEIRLRCRNIDMKSLQRSKIFRFNITI